MGVITYDMEIPSSIPAPKMFKAFVLEGDTLLPKILPQAVKSVETLEGDGGAGTIKLITFGQGSVHKCVKHRVDAINKENFTYSYSVVGGDALADEFESIAYHMEIVAGLDGGSVYKNRGVYNTKGDAQVTQERIKSVKEKASSIFKAVEVYLLANPDAYHS